MMVMMMTMAVKFCDDDESSDACDGYDDNDDGVDACDDDDDDDDDDDCLLYFTGAVGQWRWTAHDLEVCSREDAVVLVWSLTLSHHNHRQHRRPGVPCPYLSSHQTSSVAMR